VGASQPGARGLGECEAGALAEFGFEGDGSAGLSDQAVDHDESEAGGDGAGLGGEEGLHASGLDLVGHAGAVVGDADLDGGAVDPAADVDASAAAGRHGVTGVLDEVEDDLCESGPGDDGGASGGREVAFEDGAAGEDALEDAAGVGPPGAEVGDLVGRGAFGIEREEEEAVGELLEVLGGGADGVEVFAGLWGEAGVL